jgi:hypothetical protein
MWYIMYFTQPSATANAKTENLMDQSSLHGRSSLNQRTANNDEAAEKVGIDATFIFFKVLAVLELLPVLQDTHPKGSLSLHITNHPDHLGDLGKLFRGSAVEERWKDLVNVKRIATRKVRTAV